MLTKQEIHNQLREMGILPNDTVLVHTSLRSIGAIEGGADGLIDAFQEYLTDGMFLVPTHTCIGMLPKVAALRKDGFRSLHPTHSIWGWGNGAEEFLQGEENAKTPASPGGAWDRLADVKAKILLIGVGLDKNTYIHSVQEVAGIPDRLKEEAYDVTVLDHSGNALVHPYHRHFCSRSRDVSVQYVNFEKPLLHHGAMEFGTLGNARVRIVDAAKCKKVLLEIFSKAEMDLCIEKIEIPEEFYK